MAVVSSFPLLRLPIDERRSVLRIMRIFDLTKLSFLSKKAKRLVTSLKLKGGAVNISIDNRIRIVCTFIGVGRFEYNFPVEHQANVPTVVKQPGLIQLQEPQSGVIHTYTANFTKVRDWSKHFCTILHHENTLIRFSRNACRFDFDWIYEQFKDHAIMILRHTSGSVDYDKRIIQFLNPTTELNVPFNNHRDRLITQDKLVQNLERLSLTINFPHENFHLNDLLCINSQELNITDAKFDPKDINKFLKLWINGSNPRLQFFTMQRLRVEVLDYDTILQGIRPPALPVLLPSHLYKSCVLMAVVSSFPLLRLPVDERRNVLSSMRIFDLVILSFLSKKAKRLVAFLNIKAIKLQLVITDCIIIYCEFYSSEDEFECYLPVQHVRGVPTVLQQVNQIQFREPFFGEFYSWTENFTMIRDWLQHFCAIFNRKYPALVFSENASLFDFDWIYEQFKNPPVLDYNFDSGSREFDERVLQMLNPILALDVPFDNYLGKRIPQKVLIQNLGRLVLPDQLQQEKFLLNDLLCINAKELKITEAEISQKDINKFLKLWIQGSNPRLESLTIHDLRIESLDYDTILKGIRFEDVPEDRISTFKICHDFHFTIEGGKDIRRMDGTQANVYMNGFAENYDFCFHIRDPHLDEYSVFI